MTDFYFQTVSICKNRNLVILIFKKIGLPDPRERFPHYSFELSRGGVLVSVGFVGIGIGVDQFKCSIITIFMIWLNTYSALQMQICLPIAHKLGYCYAI